MRLHRSIALGLAVFAAGACEHNQIVTVISRDGTSTIPVIQLNTAAAGGFLSGSRATNRFVSSGPFDTTITDALGRATTNPPYYRPDPSCGYGTTPMVYAPGAAATPTYTPPKFYLPAVVGSVNAFDLAGCGTTVAYIVPAGHPGNGAGNTVWEFWHEFENLGPTGTRYVMGVARYALEQRGALDIVEKLLTGAVTQPDSLVFMAGDFNPAGKTARDGFTTSCASLAVVHPTAGANPHLLGSDTSRSGTIDLDQTICAAAGEAWGNLGTATSPVPRNDATALGNVQYNFYVVWEALADSTPDYSKPVYRLQIGPLPMASGAIINNAFAPEPTAALNSGQLALLPGSTAAPDTIRLTGTNLVPLAAGTSYQVWLAATGSGEFAKVTGNVVRLAGTTVVDTLFGVSDFNVTGGMTSARMEFDFLPFQAVAYNTAVIAIGATAASTIPAGQPLWTPMVTQKVPGGALPVLSSTLTFGSFNGGTSSLVFGAAGTGTGGIFGRELREDIRRIPRPPVGYYYQAYLVSSSGATAPLSLGPLASPYPELEALIDADVSNAPPVSGVEITQAALRYEAASAAFYCDWDRVQVRLSPKGSAGAVPPTILLSGTNPQEGCT